MRTLDYSFWRVVAGTAGVLFLSAFLFTYVPGSAGSSCTRSLPQVSALATTEVKLLRDVTYATADNLPLKLDVYRLDPPPAKPAPAVIFIHGGGWSGGDKSDHQAMLGVVARAGYVVFSINYRLSQQALFPAQIHDCKAAVRWVRANAQTYGADARRIGVFGTSAGGHLAALLGTSGGVGELEGSLGNELQSSRVAAVCDWFGPADLRSSARLTGDAAKIVTQLLGGQPAENPHLAELASPVCFIDQSDPPFLIIHGRSDPLVPYAQSTELRDVLEAAGVPVELITVPGGKHGNFAATKPSVEELTKRMIAFFDKQLKAPR